MIAPMPVIIGTLKNMGKIDGKDPLKTIKTSAQNKAQQKWVYNSWDILYNSIHIYVYI